MITRATHLPLPVAPSPEVIKALLRQDLYSFSVKAFAHVFPGIEYLPSWHHKVIAYHLTQVFEGGNDEIWQSWDTAIKADELNDYSACVTVLVRDRRYYILNVYRARLDYPSLKQQIVQRAQAFGGDRVRVLIEDKGSGSSLIQDLRYDRLVRPIAFEPEGDKVSRLVCQTAVIERGDVFLPETAPWLDAFRKEILQFPHGKNDDQVDALSQFLNHMTERYRNRAIVMPLDEFLGRFRYG